MVMPRASARGVGERRGARGEGRGFGRGSEPGREAETASGDIFCLGCCRESPVLVIARRPASGTECAGLVTASRPSSNVPEFQLPKKSGCQSSKLQERASPVHKVQGQRSMVWKSELLKRPKHPQIVVRSKAVRSTATKQRPCLRSICPGSADHHVLGVEGSPLHCVTDGRESSRLGLT